MWDSVQLSCQPHLYGYSPEMEGVLSTVVPIRPVVILYLDLLDLQDGRDLGINMSYPFLMTNSVSLYCFIMSCPHDTKL